MIIDTRLPAAVRRMLLALVLVLMLMLIPSITGAFSADPAAAPEAPPTAVTEAAERYASDPLGAVAALQALLADPSHPDHAAAGLQLLRAYATERRFDEAKRLADTLLAAPATDNRFEVNLLERELARRVSARDVDGLEALEPRVQAAARLDDVPAIDRAKMLQQLMTLYYGIPRLSDAIVTIKAALALLGDTPSEPLLVALRAKGGIHAMQGQFPEAIESLMGAERVVAALGRPADAGILRNLAGIFISLGEFDRAIEYAERAEKMQEGQTPASRLGVLSMLATAHIAAGHFEQGRHWSQAALTFGRERKLPISGVLNNYAALLRDEGRHAEALAAFRELLPQLSPSDPPDVRGVVEKNIGETLVALKRRAEAAPHLQRARELYETADVRPKRLELYPVLIENLEALGRTSDALTAMHEFKALSDEVISTESRTRIGELENTIDLARKEQALAESEAANDLQRAENAALQASESRASAINLALLACLVAVAAVLALLWRTHRLRNRSHRELTARNVEIEQQRSALQQLNASIQQQSREDALTGLGNRRYLLESLAASSTADTGVLVMADLDHFKRINDSHGHDTGDLALKLFADALRSVARQGDMLVRWGGEEFVWLCRGAALDQGPALCERLLRQLREQPLMVNDQPLHVTVSLGFVPLSIWADTAPDWDGALKIADYAVYCSKASGRDTWTGFVGVGSSRPRAGLSPGALEERGVLQRLRSPAQVETESSG